MRSAPCVDHSAKWVPEIGLLSVKQPFYILVFGLDQEFATKWLYNWFTELILGAFCTIFRAWPLGAGLGAKLGREMAEKDENLSVGREVVLVEQKTKCRCALQAKA